MSMQEPQADHVMLHGLAAKDINARLWRYGLNRLPEPETSSLPAVFFRQFKSPLIYILLFAAAISLVVNEIGDAIFIGIVLLANAFIGGAHEYSAGRSAAALRKLEQPRAMVIRDAQRQEIDARTIVPGDLVVLESGGRVPADLSLTEAQDLLCDESLLTGESKPSRKFAGLGSSSVEDRRTVAAFAGTLVVRGRGMGVVVATGRSTELGSIASEIGRASASQPPLMIRLAHFSNVIAWTVGAASLILIAMGSWRGMAWNDLILMAVGLAVSAIPEGLPIAISVALAISMHRMARCNVIVRRMPAVEALGSCTMIATDKTGTLTRNELTVTDIRLPDGTDLKLDVASDLDACAIKGAGMEVPKARKLAMALLEAASLPNEGRLIDDPDGWRGVGDGVDIALLGAARKAGLNRESIAADYPLITRVPYEPDLKFAASFHRRDGQVHIFVKGSPETLIDMANRMDFKGQAVAIDRDTLIAQKDEMAGQGLRVLGLAAGQIRDTGASDYGREHLVDLIFLGLAGMQDPIRHEVPAAIGQCRAAGVEVVMVTGDDPKTAAAIAIQAGLDFEPDQVTTGDAVSKAETAGTAQLDELTRQARIYARVAPAQKLAIVLSLARNGHFVAVTGDGVNDAPALKHAHVGVAMGLKGTEVAKDSADVVIRDDNFASIVSGISEGRTAYSNIRKVTLMLVATGAAEMLLFLLAIPLGLPLPLLPVQLLWLNLVTNGIQDVALAGERPEGDELLRPPRRPKEPIFDRLMIRRIIQSTLVIGLGGFAVFYWLLSQGYELSQARNILLLLFVLFENVQTLACRSERRSMLAMSLLHNPLLIVAICASQSLHLAAMHLPWLRETLQLAPISLSEWILLLLLSTSLAAMTELDKMFARGFRGSLASVSKGAR